MSKMVIMSENGFIVVKYSYKNYIIYKKRLIFLERKTILYYL